jgi:hypothetical protein
LIVEHLARIAKPRYLKPKVLEVLAPVGQGVCATVGLVRLALVCDYVCKIEHMKFGPGIAQEMSEEYESPGVPEPNGVPAMAYRPVFAFFAENRPRWPGGALKHGCHGDLRSFSMLSLRFHVVAIPFARHHVQAESTVARNL